VAAEAYERTFDWKQIGRGFVRTKRAFWAQACFLPFLHWKDGDGLDWVDTRRNETFTIWSSFLDIGDAVFIFSCGNPEMVIFLPSSCSNQDRTGGNLTVNYAYVYGWTLFVSEMPGCAFLQGCQHAHIVKKSSSFLVWKERYENTRQRLRQHLTGILVLRKRLQV